VPPVCCELHLHRYLPRPDTPGEEAAVRAAERRWSNNFYFDDRVLPGEPDYDGRRSTEGLPDYVIALLP
jgi:hypothetical protein